MAVSVNGQDFKGELVWSGRAAVCAVKSNYAGPLNGRTNRWWGRRCNSGLCATTADDKQAERAQETKNQQLLCCVGERVDLHRISSPRTHSIENNCNPWSRVKFQ